MNLLFVSAYEKARDANLQIVEMSAAQLAGYYLHHFSARPEAALNHDAASGILPLTIARPAKLLIQASILK